MKKITVIALGLMLSATALSSCGKPQNQAPSEPPKPNPEQQAKINHLQAELGKQSDATKHWQTIALSLGVGCFVLLVLGTAIGSKTRHDSASPHS